MAEEVNWDEEIIYPRLTHYLIEQGGWKEEKTLFSDLIAGNWYFYAQGYKRAADILVDTTHGEPWDDSLILPIVFLYRHFVELKLKDIILALDHLGGTTMEKLGTHDLIPLWNYLKDHLNCIRHEIVDKEIIPALDKLIAELSNLDPDSFHFRYAHDKKFLNAMPLPRSLNMKHFQGTMKIIDNGLRYLEAGIEMETESRIQDAQSAADNYTPPY